MLKSHAVAIDESNTMNHPTPQGLPVRDLTDDEKQFLHYNPNTSDLVEFVQAYAREALAAQAATLESIHKIIECAGPEAADEIADLLGYPSVEWPSDQALTAPNLACKSAQARLATQWGYVRAASVEPVGEVMEGIQTVGFGRKEIQKFVQFDQSLPVGTKLSAGAPPAHIPADAPVWNSIQIASWIGSQLMHEPAMFERSAVCKFVRSLGRHPTLLKHSPQPQAVDAEGERIDALKQVDRFFVERLAELGCLSPEAGAVHAMVRAALQASHHPQPQPQAVVASSPSPASVQDVSLVEKLAKRTCEANADSARFTIALQTLRASLDPDDWMGAVTMHNYIDAVLAGGSPLQQHPAPSPAQAVDAVGESCAIFDSRGYYDWYDTEAQAKAWCDRYNARNVDDPLRPYTYVRLDALRAALQASRQPQAQQGGGENTARAFIEWCKAQPEDRVPVSIDEALNEFEAALATKEPK